MKKTHHTHPVHIHLARGILERAELQRASYAHTGIVDEHIYPAFGLNDLPDCSLDLIFVADFSLDVHHARERIHILAVCAVNLVSLLGESLCHCTSEAGGDPRDEYDHRDNLLNYTYFLEYGSELFNCFVHLLY